MKTINTFLVALLALLATSQNLFSQDYKHPFNLGSNGQIVNQSGTKLGWIESDGTIKNAEGKVVGKVVTKKNKSFVVDVSGKKIGAVSIDGSLTINGKVVFSVGTADQNGVCLITDSSGKTVGSVHQNYKQQGACAIHCLVK